MRGVQILWLTVNPPGPSWSSISTDFLRAELARRDEETPVAKPECGSGVKGSYNTSAHVGALILILALSTIGKIFLPPPSILPLTHSPQLADSL